MAPFFVPSGGGGGTPGAPGTMVVANPAGDDGDDLLRIAIAGTNWNIPGSGGDLPTGSGRERTQLDQLTGQTIPASSTGNIFQFRWTADEGDPVIEYDELLVHVEVGSAQYLFSYPDARNVEAAVRHNMLSSAPDLFEDPTFTYHSTSTRGINLVLQREAGTTAITTAVMSLYGVKYVATTGRRGPTGPVSTTPGPQGTRGSLWAAGAGAPSDSAFQTAAGQAARTLDFWLRTDAPIGDVYMRGARTWSRVGNIRGQRGLPGTPGTRGTPGQRGQSGTQWRTSAGVPGQGADTNAWYLDTDPATLGNVYAWTSLVWETLVNIRGSKGDKGDAGDPGTPGPITLDGGRATIMYNDGTGQDGNTYKAVPGVNVPAPDIPNDAAYELELTTASIGKRTAIIVASEIRDLPVSTDGATVTPGGTEIVIADPSEQVNFHFARTAAGGLLVGLEPTDTYGTISITVGILALIGFQGPIGPEGDGQPNAVSGLALRQTTLVGTRVSGENPIEVDLSSLGGGGGGDAPSSNPEVTLLATVNAGARYQSVTAHSPLSPSSATKATPAKMGLLTAGSRLAPWATGLDETDDEVTLEPGLYIATFLHGVYNAATGDTLQGDNSRADSYHDARMEISGAQTVLSTVFNESYIRPIGGDSATDPPYYGGNASAIIFRVPQRGPVSFYCALTGQDTANWLGNISISVYRINGPAVTPSTSPSVSRFTLDGDLSPAAGAIDETYQYDFAVAQSSHVSAMRIVGFAGTDAAPSSVSVLATIAAADYHGGMGSIRVRGFSLAADAVYTVRLEAYGEGQTPASDQPVSYHDVRIRAHATAAQVRFFRVPKRVNNARPTAANLVANMAVIATAGSVIGDWTAMGIPDDTNTYLLGWIVPASGTQPSHYVSGGINQDAAFAPAFNLMDNSVAYRVYMAYDEADVGHAYNGTVITVS